MLFHIGYGNYVKFEEIKAIEEKYETGYISKIIFSHKLKNTNKIYDFTYGHLRKSLVLMKDNTCIYSGIMVSSLINRWKNINQIETKDNIDNMLYVGKDNYVNINDIYMMSGNVKSKPLVSKIKIAKENMNFIDFTGGDKMRSILFMKDGTIIVTSLDDRTLLERLKNIIIL